ncbi:Ig-like domain-containing protein (plasmid) [Myxococcus sp. MxC21-1]|uniref:Ig-like domain-containing protein n=1 Tax=Myxococcus sp. MxC21-1 TaxID=3041439 RepID=UPI00292DD9ED|nr:Ig-like domain-containing protein [Myxococcus sp. MxC21-1]WNZ66226.1 Ig-like domain-containing protein [Myxococcus sp. MxC21-1]
MLRSSAFACFARFGALLFLGGTLSCGGGTPVSIDGLSEGELSGTVIKGPVADASVTVFKLDGRLSRGTRLGEARTDEAGAFTIRVGSYNGPLAIVATSGLYTDEAGGTPVSLGARELVTILPAYRSGSNVTGIRVTPVSSIAAGLATFHVQQGAGVEEAVSEAFRHVNTHFGDVDWRTTAAADLTVEGVTTMTPGARAGLVLAALSQQAAGIAAEAGVSVALVNGASLGAALAADAAADGVLDGAGPSGTLRQGSVALDAWTARAGLAQALATFVSGPRNRSTLRLGDVRTMVNAMSTSADAYLFGNTPGTVIDVDPPEVSWLKPAPDSGVSGTAPLEVRATDASGLQSFRFTAPASLVALQPSIEGTSALLTGTLDVSALPDGPLAIQVVAEDKRGNITSSTANVIVSNRGPSISVSAPSDGTTVRGQVLLTATASAQQGVVQRLELRDPPPGVGADTLAAADSFAAQWDTTKAREGSTSSCSAPWTPTARRPTFP